MTAFTEATAGVKSALVAPNTGVTLLSVSVPATFVFGTDTLAVDLTAHGAKNLRGIWGFSETTDGSIVIVTTQTTSVTAGTLTITPDCSGSTTNKGTFLLLVN